MAEVRLTARAKLDLKAIWRGIDDQNPAAAIRVQLALSGNPAFTKKTSRVEIFFRDFASSTLINIYQFDVKGRHVESILAVWDEEVFGPWRPRG